MKSLQPKPQKESLGLPPAQGSQITKIDAGLVKAKDTNALATLPEQSKGTVLRIIYGLVSNENTFLSLEKDCTLKFCVGSPSVSSQMVAFGRANVSRSLDLMLMRLSIMMNVKHNITDAQIKVIVNDLLELFPNESLEDWVLVFKRMRQGYYGPSYHLLSLATIVECMKLHLDEKYQLVEKLLAEEKKEEEKLLSDEDIIKGYERLKKEGLPPEQKSKRKNDDEAYNQARTEYLRNKMINDKAKSDAQRSERKGVDEPNPGNEQAG